MTQRQTLLAPKETNLKKPYSLGPYNKCNESEQWIRISEGCPHQHPYCYEPAEIKVFEIPEIVRNRVKIMDMNLLCKPSALDIIKDLGQKRVKGRVVHYEFICGIDFRFFTSEIAEALKASRFENIRLAWDWYLSDQYKVKDTLDALVKVGYARNSLMVFMICNWKIPYETNLEKLDLCKVWNVKVADCWYDNQVSPKIIPIHWTSEQITDFRPRCRKHNQLVVFGIDPEVSRL